MRKSGRKLGRRATPGRRTTGRKPVNNCKQGAQQGDGQFFLSATHSTRNSSRRWCQVKKNYTVLGSSAFNHCPLLGLPEHHLQLAGPPRRRFGAQPRRVGGGTCSGRHGGRKYGTMCAAGYYRSPLLQAFCKVRASEPSQPRRTNGAASGRAQGREGGAPCVLRLASGNGCS